MRPSGSNLQTFTLCYSPCPNDTYIFYALSNGRVETPFNLDVSLADVEMLNRLLTEGRLDMSKLSVSVVPRILDEYWLLRSGGAIGRGCGPLIVSRRQSRIQDLREATIAIPGMLTTAHLLLRLEGTHRGNCLPMQFDRIMPAVSAGEVDAGVIIHEGRFTFQSYGLHKVLDLGQWWENETGLPLPLGAIAIRRSLGGELAGIVENKIRESLRYSMANPGEAWHYIRRHAQEMDPEVIHRHIETFVNDFSLDAGAEGERALRIIIEAACKLDGKPFPEHSLFWS